MDTSPDKSRLGTNRLAQCASLYLRQHAINPVDWFPWGDEALDLARTENRPIFLSIGYSACHWCHVMEREIFEDLSIADLLNAHFVNIKVDREERPDLDAVYLAAVQEMTGSGGWPLNVFLTPDLKPFFGGTYFPTEDRSGSPGFATMLRNVIAAWETRPAELRQSAETLTEAVRQALATDTHHPGPLDISLVDSATEAFAQRFDAVAGGFGEAPKFPPCGPLRLLLLLNAHEPDPQCLHMVTTTLKHMACGGIHDHLGGGFHRYAVEAQWRVPHFEKMLYDNAQLSRLYLDAYQATGNAGYRDVARTTLDYVRRDMTDPGGAFHASEDADSEGKEGRFYVWTDGEIAQSLDPEDARLVRAWYDVRPEGNFETHEPHLARCNILHTPHEPSSIAGQFGLSSTQFEERIVRARSRLLTVRNRRNHPGRDEKIVTAWNALMISALAHAYRVLGDENDRVAAAKAGDFLLSGLFRGGELKRSCYRNEPSGPGYLDDYAAAVNAMLDLYEMTFDLRQLDAARTLADEMNARFWDETAGCFSYTCARHTDVIARSYPAFDHAEPSGNALAAEALVRLRRITGNERFAIRARRVFETHAATMARAPHAVSRMLAALDHLLRPGREAVVAGPRNDPAVQGFLQLLWRGYEPNGLVLWMDPTDGNNAQAAAQIPFLEGKDLISGRPAVYICRGGACEAPITQPDELLGRWGL